MDSAKKELIWLIVIVVGIFFIWIVSGGPKSMTKNSPVIQPVAGQQSSTTGGWFSFLFPKFGSANNSYTVGATSSSGGRLSGNTVRGNVIKSGAADNSTISVDKQTKTLYGADQPPGPIINVPDKIQITSVSRSSDSTGKSDSEYVVLSAPSTNQKPILLTGMLLKSRMTGNQVDIRNGVKVYYANSINSDEPINLNPGETAYIITGRSPVGYSFKINKCIGYLNNNYQKFIIGLPGGCPRVTDYPLPARPNAFNDSCLDFLSTIKSCQTVSKYPDNLQPTCRTFVAERANYSRCVTDFGNDANFLGKEWRIYLGRDYASWKTRREIVDLIDQKGNVISTYTY